MKHLVLTTLVALGLLFGGTAAAKTSIKVNEMTVDGLTVMAVDCKLTGGGFMAGAVLIGSLAKQKRPIDKCGPKGQAARLQFMLGGKGPKDIKALASSTKKTGPCMVKALKKVKTTLKGQCTMTLLSGPKPAAKKAAAALPVKP